MSAAQPKVDDVLFVDSPKWPGAWRVAEISARGRQLILLDPVRDHAEHPNRAQRGLRITREQLSDTPYDPFSVQWIDLGTVIKFKDTVVARKPDYRGLWVITTDTRNDTFACYRLGGSDVRIKGVTRAVFNVVPLDEIAAHLPAPAEAVSE